VPVRGRHDRINPTDRQLSPLDHDGRTFTAAPNWYLSGKMSLMSDFLPFADATASAILFAPMGGVAAGLRSNL
jgi:hypothetical protein